MPRKTVPAKQKSGSKRRAESGLKHVPAWVTPEEHALIGLAAAADRRSMSALASAALVEAAKKILEKSSNSA